MLRIAIQAKGRLNEESVELLAEAGVSIEESKRKLLTRCDDFPLDAFSRYFQALEKSSTTR